MLKKFSPLARKLQPEILHSSIFNVHDKCVYFKVKSIKNITFFQAHHSIENLPYYVPFFLVHADGLLQLFSSTSCNCHGHERTITDYGIYLEIYFLISVFAGSLSRFLCSGTMPETSPVVMIMPPQSMNFSSRFEERYFLMISFLQLGMTK